MNQYVRTFDAAAAVARTPSCFSTDITPMARPIAINGSGELNRAGWHREAVFWIVATFARCQEVLTADGLQDLQRRRTPASDAIMVDLGITSVDDVVRRAEDVTRFLPTLQKTVEAVLG